MLEVNFGHRIKLLRRRLKWSQLHLELEANFCPGTISRLENNKINPSKETLFRIGAAMNLGSEDAMYLFGIDQLCEANKPQLQFEFKSSD